jgi:hypothetical protein
VVPLDVPHRHRQGYYTSARGDSPKWVNGRLAGLYLCSSYLYRPPPVRCVRRHGGNATTRDIVKNNVGNIKTASDAVKLFHEVADRGLGLVTEKKKAGGTSVTFHLRKGAESWEAEEAPVSAA